ncbi:MAG: MFS transporter [Novosphingobium sp. 28-62-57]|uniref:multidrug effflux MFS transporter n=1 Tax=unclassified Novosphingobium TaxID=2644732 RepID=UPI000BCFC10F|nr:MULTISPECIES: multidrug effflux MFS transporter [unclassified Novosphingobium]OYW51352.1 MAG: MFS transporter [Novosphingobium sp. 12-62-10]OYZ10616.1 MAG: MFS transporter [Novosphingobium sp. 28-62-57]OZA40741.1 MAG: MFS transporter [Novosphingobium sp. 17-62-9]HQS70118.1 multidrug effflux MFS transporter [Novosphingobium sp.]
MTKADQPAGYRVTILTLAAIAAMGSMAIHMLVPALPLIAADFAIGEARAQQVVSVYLAGLAAGQLVAGPLADRLGRRPVMLSGLTLYILGSAAAAFAAKPEWLLLARLVQALGGACGVVTARVMVGDVFGQARAAGVQATLMTIVLISPAIAPVIGGAVADFAGWRAVFALLACAGMLALVAAWQRLAETSAGQRRPAQARSLLGDYAQLARNRRFVLTTLTLCAASSGLYMFLGAAPFLLVHRFGLSSAEAGLALLVIAAASIGGTRLVVPVERRFSALILGTASSATGASIAFVLAVSGIEGVVPLIAPITLLGLGAGLAGPVAFNAVAFAEAGLAATATSLAGALQMLASGTAMALLGLLAPLDPLRVACALVLAAGIALASALGARATHGAK